MRQPGGPSALDKNPRARGRLAPPASFRLHRGAELGWLESGAFLEQVLQIAIAQVYDPPAGAQAHGILGSSSTAPILPRFPTVRSNRSIIRTMKHRHRRRGIVRTQASLPPEVMDVLLKLRPVFEREFRERFGRELRPDDPVFWSRSRSGDEPVPMTEEEIEQAIDEHLDEVFYTVVLVEDERAREDFLAFMRDQGEEEEAQQIIAAAIRNKSSQAYVM
jgi:hypothetical protein